MKTIAVTNFKKWLSQNGAELLEPTNQWELVRFRGNTGTSIVYTNAKGNNTFTNEAAKAWDCFIKGFPWRAVPKARRIPTKPIVRTLLKRDGDRCFFCGLTMAAGEESVDHLVAVTHGGPNHVSNYVLMHVPCNQQCGNMSAAEKIRAHVEWRVATWANCALCQTQRGRNEPNDYSRNTRRFG